MSQQALSLEFSIRAVIDTITLLPILQMKIIPNIYPQRFSHSCSTEGKNVMQLLKQMQSTYSHFFLHALQKNKIWKHSWKNSDFSFDAIFGRRGR